jgi:dienelactone hydrolase
MRTFEILLCFLVVAGSVLLLVKAPIPSPALTTLLVLLGILAIAHWIYEGMHWQLIPLYIAGGVLAVCALALVRGLAPPSSALRFCGGLSLLSALAAIALSWLLPMFRLPKPTGPHAVGTRILHLVDSRRDAEGGHRPDNWRELMVQVWYPAEPVRARREVYRRRRETTLKSSYQSVLRTQSLRNAPISGADAPHPLLIFSPAWTGQRTQSTFLMQELASHGFVVASIDHTCYSGLVAFPDGRVLDGHMAPALGDFTRLSIEEGIELADQFVLILAEDISFVLDEMTALNESLEGDWRGRLDLSRIGVLGHSLGGAAAAEACRLDSRIHAALNLDGWTFGQVLRQGLAKPWMVVYGKGVDVEPRDLAAQSEGIQRYWQMNRENYAIVEAALQRDGGYLLTIRGASHWNFSDRALYSPIRKQTQAGTIRPELAHQIIADVTRAFFREQLNGEAGMVAAVVRKYPEASVPVSPSGVMQVRG